MLVDGAASRWAASTSRNGRSARSATLNHQPTAARLFHEQDWGGLIAAECQPIRRSYLDDRFELFGKEAILEYVDVLSGGPAWDTVRDRDRIEMVWLRPDRGLAKRLLKEPGWSVALSRQGLDPVQAGAGEPAHGAVVAVGKPTFRTNPVWLVSLASDVSNVLRLKRANAG